MTRPDRERLDQALVRRGFFSSRQAAAAAVMAGAVRVGGQPADKPGQAVPPGAEIEVSERGPGYASRGGLKLAAALDAFGVDPAGWTCLDVGASTGGFTDCLLQRGAVRVYAVDVGYGQLAWRLRTDPRVVVLERVNARYLGAEHVPEPVDLAVLDLAFISLAKVLPAVLPRIRADGCAVPLVKPQFEAGPQLVGKGGIVRDPRVHRAVLAAVGEAAAALGWPLQSIIPSPIRGADGNREFLALARPRPSVTSLADLVARAVDGDDGPGACYPGG